MTRWIVAAVIDWAVIIACMAAIAQWPLSALVMIFIIGTRQHALGILGHDGAHSSITKPLWLNDALAQVLCWWPIGAGIDSYRWFHLTHHRLLGRDGDPELTLKAKFPLFYAPPFQDDHRAVMFVLDLLGVTSVIEYFALFRMMLAHSSVRDRVGTVAMWLTAAIVLMRFGLLWVLMVWAIALVTSFWAVGRLRTWREHMDTKPGETMNLPVPWWGCLLHLPHGIGHHAEHHKCAWRAFYNLGHARQS